MRSSRCRAVWAPSLAEAATWTQLGLHAKPVGLLNVGGFYDRLLAFLDHAAEEQFLRTDHRALVLDDPDPESLLAALQAWRAPTRPDPSIR